MDVYSVSYLQSLLKIYEEYKLKYLPDRTINYLQKSIQVLREWNNEMAVDSIGASIYVVWEREIIQTFFADKFPNDTQRHNLFLDKN